MNESIEKVKDMKIQELNKKKIQIKKVHFNKI